MIPGLADEDDGSPECGDGDLRASFPGGSAPPFTPGVKPFLVDYN
jgi:hypothetical protein